MPFFLSLVVIIFWKFFYLTPLQSILYTISIFFVNTVSFFIVLRHIQSLDQKKSLIQLENQASGPDNVFMKKFALGLTLRFIFFVGLAIFHIVYWPQRLMSVLLLFIVIFFIVLVFEFIVFFRKGF